MSIRFLLEKGIALTTLALCLLTASWLAHAAPQPVDGNFNRIFDNRSVQLTIWRYSDNPNVFVFDFPGLSYQGRTFNRITQFTEQQTTEPYPRVLTAQEMAARLIASRRSESDFAFGHDVMVYELVQFFNFAQRDKVPLNAEEEVVKNFLLEQGLMKTYRDIFQATSPNTVILSIPQMQEKTSAEPLINRDARYAILLHEFSHGEYYSNPYYAKYCQRFWQESLTEAQREAFKKFLSGYNYSTGSEDLLINESQAYLMFTPDVHSFSAKKLGVSWDELEAMRDAFRKGKPPTKLPLIWNLGDIK
ncbi:MAG TPA: hypothetical protein VJ001_15080 [Rhodocyclaceae bacterium]|nr:hypothetical protein [Rhodocyclaceae bacterium]